MTRSDLRHFREKRGWTQQELAQRLQVSQTLVSLWEKGERRLPARRLRQLRRLGMQLDPLALPMRNKSSLGIVVDYGKELSNLAYPGFEHSRDGDPRWNPAELLVRALSEKNLDRRVAEALPWLVLRYWEMDWGWVWREVKVRDLQNRLGFTLTLARKLAVQQKEESDAALRLRELEESLRGSLLAKEDTYCYEGMTEAERTWLRTKRSPEASTWNVLSDLEPGYLTHA
jgi:transcriptional regulator with XRE-family HTH domain